MPPTRVLTTLYSSVRITTSTVISTTSTMEKMVTALRTVLNENTSVKSNPPASKPVEDTICVTWSNTPTTFSMPHRIAAATI